MDTRSFVRSAVSLAIVFTVLTVILVALGQVPNARAERSRVATDYTVGGACGSTIQACINNPIVVAGDRILIPAGTYIESITLNKAVSLVGDDATTTIINAIGGQRVLTVTGVTINSSIVISGLTFAGGYVTSYPGGGGIWFTDQAQPIVQNTIITNNTAYDQRGGGIAADTDLTLINVNVLSNTAAQGGGIYSGGNVQLTDGLVDNNRNWVDFPLLNGGGGGLYAAGLSMTGTVFSNNSSSADFGGGGVFVNGSANLLSGQFLNNHDISASSTGAFGGGIAVQGNLTVSGTQFIGNISHKGCGGVSASSATITNSRFESNQAIDYLSDGGGLCVNSNVTTLNSDFVSNTTDELGGGIYALNAVLIGGHFEGNRTTNTFGSGGAVFVQGTLVLTDTDVVSNTSYNSGGGVNANTSTLYGGRFERNTSFYGGGGGLSTVALTLSGTQFVSNVAAYSGGGINTIGATNLIGGLFAGNQVTSTLFGGGGALSVNGQLNITDTQFIANTSATNGGAVMHGGSSGIMRIVNTLFSRNQATSDGASLYLTAYNGTDAILFSTIADTSFNSKSAILVGMQGALGITDTIVANHAIGINNTSFRPSYQDYNLFFGNTQNLSGTISGGSHNPTGNPLFADPPNSDYHLEAGSAAIDKGIFAGVTTDIEGNSRLPDYGGLRVDIGAYEFHYQGVIYSTYLPLVLKNH